MKETLNFAFWTFFSQHKILLWYEVMINVVTFIIFAVDKYKAIRHKYRIRVVTLLGLAFIGGSIGGLLSMYLFRHKTRKPAFTVGIPIMMAMQIAGMVCLINVV